jgi:hypothetical protein
MDVLPSLQQERQLLGEDPHGATIFVAVFRDTMMAGRPTFVPSTVWATASTDYFTTSTSTSVQESRLSSRPIARQGLVKNHERDL